MGYRVLPTFTQKKHPISGKVRKKTIGFRIVFEDRTNGERNFTTLDEGEWHTVNVTTDMTMEEAKKRVSLYNKDKDKKRHARRRHAIQKRLETESNQLALLLNPDDVKEFEQNRLIAGWVSSKAEIHWRVAKRLLSSPAIVRLDVSQWEDEAQIFYAHFAKHGYSLGYINKLMRWLNSWGKFIAKKYKKPFDPIPPPPPHAQKLIKKAHTGKEKKNGGRESAPLTLDLLAEKKSELTTDEFIAIKITLCFGLRPEECRRLLQSPGQYWKLTKEEGIDVLSIFQTKTQKWKFVPFHFDCQKECLDAIRTQKHKLPSVKRVITVFGPEFTRYMGRKGFTRLMESFKVPFQVASRWAGHSNVETTFEHYYPDKIITFVPNSPSKPTKVA